MGSTNKYDEAVLKMAKGAFRECRACRMPFMRGANCSHCGETSPHVLVGSGVIGVKSAFYCTFDEWAQLLNNAPPKEKTNE